MYYQRTGHHTCKDSGDRDVLTERAPFKSKYDSEHKPFLGSGYYIWEDDLELAKWWGKVHYGKKFVIIEMILNIYDDELLDLVGNARQIREFRQMYFEVKQKYSNLTLGKFIELLKRKGIFKYNIIKAIDTRPFMGEREKYYIRFSENQKTYLNLHPRIFYCFLVNSSKYFTKKKIVFVSNER